MLPQCMFLKVIVFFSSIKYFPVYLFAGFREWRTSGVPVFLAPSSTPPAPRAGMLQEAPLPFWPDEVLLAL